MVGGQYKKRVTPRQTTIKHEALLCAYTGMENVRTQGISTTQEKASRIVGPCPCPRERVKKIHMPPIVFLERDAEAYVQLPRKRRLIKQLESIR